MNAKKLLSFLPFAFALMACTNGTEVIEQEPGQLIIKIDGSTITDSLNISDLIEEIEVIPLVEEDPYFFRDIYQIFYTNNKYVINDRFDNQILLFDEDGKFIKKVLGKGKGPGEVVQINDVWVNSDGTFEVYDFALKKIFRFNKDFQFEETIPAGRNIYTNLQRLPESEKFLAYENLNSQNPKVTDKNYQLKVLSQDFEVETGYLPYSDDLKGSLTTSFIDHFYLMGDSIRVFRPYDNTVYQLEGNELKKWASFDYQDRTLPYSTFEIIVEENQEVFKNTDGAAFTKEIRKFFEEFSYFRGIWVENGDYVLFKSNRQNGTFTSIYDKKGRQVIANTKKLYEYQKYNMILPELTATGDGYFVGFFHSLYLKYYLIGESELDHYKNPENPCFLVVKVKLKE